MEIIKINWIIEIPDYQVEAELKMIIDKVLEDYKPYLNFSKLDIILIPFAINPGFKKTLEKHKLYFFNLSELKNQPFIENAFAVFVPDTLLKDLDLCLIFGKVFKYMRVSILHEMFHKLFENNNFKRKYMPGNYFREGTDFATYLEEFFVETLAIESNITYILNNKSNMDEYLELNDSNETIIIETTLKIYEGFKTHGGYDFKGLLISLLSCYFIFFSTWRVTMKTKPEFEDILKELWNKILDLKELEFFKKNMIKMQKIFIEEDVASITDKMQLLFNSL